MGAACQTLKLHVWQKSDPRRNLQNLLYPTALAERATARKVCKKKILSKWSFRDLIYGKDSTTSGLR